MVDNNLEIFENKEKKIYKSFTTLAVYEEVFPIVVQTLTLLRKAPSFREREREKRAEFLFKYS